MPQNTDNAQNLLAGFDRAMSAATHNSKKTEKNLDKQHSEQ